MLKLNRIQQHKDVISEMIDRISNECIVSAKSAKAKKRLVRALVEVSDIGTDVEQLQEMIDNAVVLSSNLSIHEEDRFSKCAEHLAKAKEAIK